MNPLTRCGSIDELSTWTGKSYTSDGSLILAGTLYYSKQEDEMNKNLLKTVFNGVALAMGVAVIVLNIVNPPTLAGTTSMLGIAVAALGIAGLQKE